MTDEQKTRILTWALAILVLLMWLTAGTLLLTGCNGPYYDGEAVVRTQAQRAVNQSNKSPPDPNRVTQIRDVLCRLCFICKEAGYREGIKDCNEFEADVIERTEQ